MKLFQSKYKTRIENKIIELTHVIASLESEKFNEIRESKKWLQIAITKGQIEHDITLLKSLL
jgi:hypothetical protein